MFGWFNCLCYLCGIEMNRLQQVFVWLSRIHRCRGFGIQSPTDYAFVRYVVNEHWPYYAYDLLPNDAWLTRKLGKLYFRLANWRRSCARRIWKYRQSTSQYSTLWRWCQSFPFARKTSNFGLVRRIAVFTTSNYSLNWSQWFTESSFK